MIFVREFPIDDAARAAIQARAPRFETTAELPAEAVGVESTVTWPEAADRGYRLEVVLFRCLGETWTARGVWVLDTEEGEDLTLGGPMISGPGFHA